MKLAILITKLNKVFPCFSLKNFGDRSKKTLFNHLIAVHLPCPSDLNYEINSDIDTGTTDQTNHHIVFKNCTNSQFTEPEKYVH